MKERFLNFLKWFFIVLGVLFFIQLLLLSGIFICFSAIKEPDIKSFEIKPVNIKAKEIQPIIDYAEKFRSENNKYPDSVDIQIKKGEYEYSTSNNSDCYKIIYKNKKSENTYERCTMGSENSSSKSESYLEVTK